MSQRNRSPVAGSVLAVALAAAACADDRPLPVEPPHEIAFSSSASGGSAGGGHLVVFGGDALPADVDARVAALGGSLAARIDGIAVAVVEGLTDEAAAALAAADDVAYVERDEVYQWIEPGRAMVVEAMDADAASPEAPQTAFFFPRQWHHRAIGADRAWAAGRLGSPGVTVAILDSGIDHTYPDLVGRVDLSRSAAFNTFDNPIIDAVFPGRPHTSDLSAHGTHVASTVSSNALVGAGVTSRTTLLAIKVLNILGAGPFSAILAGIVHSADVGADVINMSLGGTFSKEANSGLVAAINRAINYAHRRGVTIVVAAGNSAADMLGAGDIYFAFCGSTQVICVSALAPTAAGGANGPWTGVDAPAPYTNFGRNVIDVGGPGGRGGLAGNGGLVWAACSRTWLIVQGGMLFHSTCSANPGLAFILGSAGTSMAAPHAAGLAALLVERYGRNPGAIRNHMRNTADRVAGNGQHPIYGRGRISVPKALGLN
jgi:subtilisin family serine protease